MKVLKFENKDILMLIFCFNYKMIDNQDFIIHGRTR